jgi:hypothetical protein
VRDAIYPSQKVIEVQIQEIPLNQMKTLLPGYPSQVSPLALPGIVAGEAVHPHYLVAQLQQPFREVRPYEPCCSCY